jgi:hypothetical protein
MYFITNLFNYNKMINTGTDNMTSVAAATSTITEPVYCTNTTVGFTYTLSDDERCLSHDLNYQVDIEGHQNEG